MAGDDFPITTINTPTIPFLGGLGIGNIDLRSLASELSPRVTDPFVDTADGTATRPATAATTEGPHRYTVFVPNTDEYSVLNVGAADPAANRINDMGLTGKSKTHIHLHTTLAANQTMVALGGGTTHGWPSFQANQLAGNAGFMMVTENKAWLDANNQFTVVSRLEDVVIRAAAKDVRVQADTQNVQIAAKNDVELGAVHNVTIVADTGATLDENGYAKKFDGYWSESIGKFGNKELMTVLDTLGAMEGLVASFNSLDKVGEDKKSGWKTDPNGVAKIVVDLAKFISTVARFAHGPKAPGQVKIAGKNYASLTGGLAASVFGNLSASLTSVLSASVVGGTAGLKGITWASIWAGTGVSIKTLTGKADLKAERGKVGINGKLDVSMASTDGKVKISAKKEAQVTSDAEAYLHGKAAAYVGCGEGEAMGLHVTPNSAWIGRITARSNEFDKPCRNVNYIEFDKETQVTIKAPKEVHTVENAVEFTSSGFKVDAKSANVEMKGAKILLG